MDFTQNAIAILLAQVNLDNSSNLTAAQVTFGVPAVGTTGLGAPATTVSITANAGSGLTGSVQVVYQRVDLGFMATLDPALVITSGAGTTLDLLPFLNSYYGLALSADDIVDEALPATQADVNTPVVLTAVATSLIYQGSVSLNLTAPVAQLSDTITVTELSGLTAPTALAG